MQAPVRRSDCPIAIALDAIGDKWSLIILRDILLNRRQKFRELRDAEEGIASNILTDRLKRLEQQGIVERRVDAKDRRQVSYAATEKGMDLIPLVLELGAWGARHGGRTTAPEGAAGAYYADRDRAISAVRAAALEDGDPTG